ncbi:type II secretion system F family protein [Neobacillus piezotolerans]|uniref:Type II secretion system F family protein n=1 Tax=Neobacillus piezotolerans TaxID=2259171 RepID=A0A3D8GL61_9BACI|nr:competence type IV pilus assembly protein ComGB [Neobacillus piezotolerans]RDU35200.1 type II secretion system F family protein [Neobacillus piezotolerans]
MRKRKWPLKEQAEFLKKAGELLQRGYHMSEAIESLSFQLHGTRKQDLVDCMALLKTGVPFHKALEEMGFNKELSGYVFFAEKHGNVAEAVLEGSNALLNRDRDARKLMKLMYYPLLLLAFTSILLFFVQNSLLPRFSLLFDSMGLEENLFTFIVSAFGQALPIVMGGAAAAIFAGFILQQFWFKSLPPLAQRKLLIRVPFAGNLLRILHTHYFSIQLCYLLSGGLSVFEALSFFVENKEQEFYSDTASLIKEQLAGGERLETILASLPFFEREFPWVVRHGQENGRLGEELRLYSKNCLAKLEGKVEKITRAIQPVMFLVIALLVVCIYMAILLPMFHMLDGI